MAAPSGRSANSASDSLFQCEPQLAEPDLGDGGLWVGGGKHIGHFAKRLRQSVDLLQLHEIASRHLAVAAQYNAETFRVVREGVKACSDAAKQLAKETGVPKRELYALLHHPEPS